MRWFGLMLVVGIVGNGTPVIAESAELRFYPVENGKVLVQQQCKKDRKIAWTRDLAATTALSPKEEVIALTKEGLIPATLGDLACFLGTCGENYVSIRLESKNADSDKLAVLKQSDAKGLKAVSVEVESVEGQCEQILSQMSHEYFPEVKDRRRCEQVSVSGKPLLLRATKEFMQDNGVPISTSKVRVISKDTDSVDVDGSLEPVVALRSSNGATRLVWRAEKGICCPREITIQSSTIDKAGKLTFGPQYTAGGQPCD